MVILRDIFSKESVSIPSVQIGYFERSKAKDLLEDILSLEIISERSVLQKVFPRFSDMRQNQVFRLK